ncbi:MAG: group 1 truncated hemoglobin [Deltaproteobacteria bacterium]|nr:group 1 truncated hemoglobin [Deltaproteobacteria bacterium]
MKRERLVKRCISGLTAFLIAALTALPGSAAGEKPATAPSLYERLGGADNIAVVVDDIIETSYKNGVFHANPRIAEGHKQFPKAAYKFKVTLLACQVTGGPYSYIGRTMKEAHQHLNISEAEWKELRAVIRGSLTKYNVPQREQDELIAIIESTKGEIIAPAVKSATSIQ